jgi:hypothetical protein
VPPVPLPNKFYRNIHRLYHTLGNLVKVKSQCFQLVVALQLLIGFFQ